MSHDPLYPQFPPSFPYEHGTFNRKTHKAVPKDAVVLDLKTLYEGVDMGGWPYVINTLRSDVPARATRRDIADQIEAQTNPPRIPEPSLWGVVEATVPESNGTRWNFVHDDTRPRQESGWTSINDGQHYAWSDLIDPTLVRPGI